MKTLLGSGAHTNVYLDQDPDYGEVIIKEPKGDLTSGDVLNYVKRQMRGFDIVNRLRQSATDIGANLPRVVRTIDTPQYHAVIEKRLPGTELKPEVYSALSEEEKEAIADKLARFLNAMHQMQEPRPAQKSIKHRFMQYGNNPGTLSEFQDVFENKLPERYIKQIAAAERLLDTGDISDEVHVVVHRDIRGQNLMYDATTGSLAIIDFEMASVDNIYTDLVAYVPCNSLAWDLIKRTVKHYNAIKNKKYPLTLDINKVRAAMIYGRMHEVARCINREKRKNPDFKITEKDIADIENLLKELLPDTDAWAHGIANIKNKSDKAAIAPAVKNIPNEALDR